MSQLWWRGGFDHLQYSQHSIFSIYSIFSIFNILNIQYSQYSLFFIMVEGWVWSPSFLNQLSSVVNTVTMSLDDSHYLYIFCVYSFISLKDLVCSIALVYCVCIYQSQKCWITYQVDLQVLEDQYIWWAYKPIDDHRGILFTTNIFPPFLALAHAGSRAFLFSDNIHITDILYDKYCSYWKWRHSRLNVFIIQKTKKSIFIHYKQKQPIYDESIIQNSDIIQE